jgi:ADP-ribosylglycohydrolase
MLIEIAVGDAYGAAFEFTRTPQIANDLSRFGRHPKGGLETGAYTDDTMRAMANCRVMLGPDSTARFRPEAYMSAYLDAFRNDRRPGWSGRFQQMLEAHVDKPPHEMMRALNRRGSNGCLMGVAPLGYLREPNEVRLAATMQTIATHAAWSSVYAQVVALAAHHLIHGGSTRTVVEYAVGEAEWMDAGQSQRFRNLLDDQPPVPDMPSHTIASGALWALSTFDSLQEMLRWTCSRGGDTDSLAAVTMALGSVAQDVRQDLPAHLLDTVETPAGRDEIMALDARLSEFLTHGDRKS